MAQSLKSELAGIISRIMVSEGDQVSKGATLLTVEAMKMETAIVAPVDMIIQQLVVKPQDLINKQEGLLKYKIISNVATEEKEAEADDSVKDDPRIEALRQRKSYLDDAARPKAIEKRRAKGQNTARENITRLVDEGSFREYGGLIVAAQRFRRSDEDLMKNTPADGLITGLATIGGAPCMVMSYDYTVLAGTQGTMNHMKMDRMIAVAREQKLPVVLFAEGGGGRPGDVDVQTIAGLFISTFTEYAALTCEVPTIAIVSGYCFAGNAALAGSSDIIIATENSSIGMGGPAMIEGGGLGSYHPKEVGPSTVQAENGVIDILVHDEDEAIDTAKRLFALYHDVDSEWTAPDQSLLQHYIPIHRKFTFDMKGLLKLVVDEGSLMFFKEGHGQGVITAMGRVEGHPIAIVANDCKHSAGAITSEYAQKMIDFLDLCNKYELPVVSFIDTPGIMVGPEAEAEGTVKAGGRLFVAGARFKQPFMSVVVRRAYGLGAMAMMGGSTHRSTFTVSWPSGEFGAMGIEGAIRLGFKKELAAIEDEKERQAMFEQLVEGMYKRGEATSMASMLEIDDVIEPAETRKWIVSVLAAQ